MNDETKSKRNRGVRSPGYPAINLRKAIGRARTLREYMPNRKPIPVDSALAQWSYKPNSGAGLQVLASVKKFGLIADEGKKDQRVVLLTDRAWTILTDPRPESPQRQKAIREAAIAPKIHGEIRERWPHGLPDDTTMEVWLMQEKNFNEKSIKGFLSQLRSTFEFAQLDSGPDTGDNEQIKSGDYVQWISEGVAQFPEPRQVVRVDEHDGEQFVFVEGANGAIPMSQAQVVDISTGATISTDPTRNEPRTLLTPSLEQPKQQGLKRETSETASGTATLAWPAYLTPEGYADLEYWLNGVLRKAKRDLSHQKPSDE